MANLNTTNVRFSRRNFLAASTAVPAALMAPSRVSEVFAANAPSSDAAAPTARPATGPKTRPTGLELYSVRTELARDLPNTLQEVAKMGYEVVEFYAPYFEWSFPHAKEVREIMGELGLRCLSTHNHIESLTPGTDGMAKAVELNQILGSKYVVLASAPGGTRGLGQWQKLCEQLTTAVDQLKPHGLLAGYHNHQAEWAALEGNQRIMEFLAAHTPKEFALQLDVGTCLEAGVDPVAWIRANPGRIKSIHLKDWNPASASGEKGYRVLFGEGISPWKELVEAAESTGGVEYYLMEQEGSRFPEFETAQRCLESWKKFRSK